jgi:ethanolamine utilization protein EutP (predicted NTPase)
MKRLLMVTSLCLTSVLAVLTTSTVYAKKVEYRKTQEVNFDAVDVDGAVRNPDGAYLVQKRGIDFVPLYKVRKNFDDNIKESVEYVK